MHTYIYIHTYIHTYIHVALGHIAKDDCNSHDQAQFPAPILNFLSSKDLPDSIIYLHISHASANNPISSPSEIIQGDLIWAPMTLSRPEWSRACAYIRDILNNLPLNYL